MRDVILIAGLLIAALAPGLRGQDAGPPTDSLTLELISPDAARGVFAPVTLLVWRLSQLPDSVVWSVHADSLDLSERVVVRGRELVADLPPHHPLGPGEHEVSADVCVPGKGCATRQVVLRVLPAELRDRAGDEDVLDALGRLLRWLIPPR